MERRNGMAAWEDSILELNSEHHSPHLTTLQPAQVGAAVIVHGLS